MVSPGDIVGSYRIQERARLGEGWWCVRRAGSEDLGELLAWEPGDISAEGATSAEDTLNRIASPTVPSVLERFDDLWILDAAPGVPLTEVLGNRLSGRAVHRPTVLAIALEVGRSLLAGHHKGRYHGHLHPDLVWLTAEGVVHVWGHGLPGAMPPADWLPPERARNKPVSGATDQWSLGALTCALVSGRAPWASDDPRAEAAIGVATLSLSPVAEQWPELGRWARRLLEGEPRLRHPSVHQVLDELEALQRKTDGFADLASLVAELTRGPEEAPATQDATPEAEATSEPEPAVPSSPSEAPADADDISEDDLVTAPVAPERRSEPVPHEVMAVVRPALSDPDVVPPALGPDDAGPVPVAEPAPTEEEAPSEGAEIGAALEEAPIEEEEEGPTARRARPPALRQPPPDSDPDPLPEPDPSPSGPAPAIAVPSPSLVPDTSELMQDPASQVDDPLDAPAKRDGKPMRTIVPRQVGGAATIIPTDGDGSPAAATEVEYVTDPGPGLTDPDGFFDEPAPPAAEQVVLEDEPGPDDVLPDEPVGDPPPPLPGAEPHPIVRFVPWIIAAMLLLMALSLVLS